jgi:hypothetical protein
MTTSGYKPALDEPGEGMKKGAEAVAGPAAPG